MNVITIVSIRDFIRTTELSSRAGPEAADTVPANRERKDRADHERTSDDAALVRSSRPRPRPSGARPSDGASRIVERVRREAGTI